jgi:phenylpropionate dioxygenase-like ring-hydroxylating dioxygenase large terminal subunit
MLSRENNERMCLVEGDTPAGRMFRAIWLPAIPSAQLGEAGGPPVRLRLLGEDLLAFRDGQGQPGIIDAFCAHRRAPLFFGKTEDAGLRCAYHGWLFDRAGQCLEIPSDATGRLCGNVQLRAYPVQEKAGIVWIYMGSGTPPALPAFPWIDMPPSRLRVSVWLQESNWFQGAEGEIDSSHVSILHLDTKSNATGGAHQKWTFLDPSPKLFIEPTEIGFMAVARRLAEDRYYWRATQWMAPMFSLIPSATIPIGGRAWVPIDDHNTYTWDFTYDPVRDITPDYLDFAGQGLFFPPEAERRVHRLHNGAVVDTWIPRRRWDNDYLIDRAAQRDHSMTGIHGVNDQDRAVQEGMGALVDRSRERLVASDVAVATARRKLLDILRSDENLQSFRDAVADGRAFRRGPIDRVNDHAELPEFLAAENLV